MLKVDEIKKMDNDGLQRKITELRGELFNLKMQKNSSGIEKPHLLKQAKRSIARLLTEERERKEG